MTAEEHKQYIESLQNELQAKLDEMEKTRKSVREIQSTLWKEKVASTAPTEIIINNAKQFGPMDDVFFNQVSEDPQAIGEIISAVYD